MKKHRSQQKIFAEISDCQYGTIRKILCKLLYEGYSCENQAAEPDYSTAKILGIDYAMQGMAVFSEKIEMEEAGFFRKNEKGWRGSSESCQDAYEEVITMNCRKRKLPDVMKRYEISEEIICTNSAERSQTVMMQLRGRYRYESNGSVPALSEKAYRIMDMDCSGNVRL